MSEIVKEEEFQRVCRLAGLIERKAKNITYVEKLGAEGIELANGTLKCFQVINPGTPEAEKKYVLTCQNKDISVVMGAFELPRNPEVKEVKASKKAHDDEKDMGKNHEIEKTQETKKEPENKNDGIKLDITIELPGVLTPALMTKWAGLSTTDRILMFQKTPPTQIYEVKVGKDPETGKAEMAPYVKGNYMIKEANAAFLFDWHLTDIQIAECPTGASVSAQLHGYFQEYGRYLSRPAVGYQETNKKVDIMQARKGAMTDAIKKGLSLFGFNSDVYGGEV